MEAAMAGHEIIFSILLEHVSEYVILSLRTSCI